jgi:hypothetical protein
VGPEQSQKEQVDEAQLQLEALGLAIAKQRARLEQLTAADVERPEAELALVILVESQQAHAARYRQLLNIEG